MDRKTRALARLAEIVEILRSPGGCPWDREQTLEDLSRYVLEEASEVRDAVLDSGGEPAAEVCEELGDVLMTVFLSARISEESECFGLAEVVETVCAKLVRRHPHIFTESGELLDASGIPDAQGVKARWDEIKAEEKAARGAPRAPSRLDGVPRSLPAVSRALAVSKKAAKAGLDWGDARAVLAKVREETRELEELLGPAPPDAPRYGQGPGAPKTAPERENRADRVEDELGDLLFTVVNLARKLALDPEKALRRSEAKFSERFRALESLESNVEDLDAAALDRAWEEAKRRVTSRSTGVPSSPSARAHASTDPEPPT